MAGCTCPTTKLDLGRFHADGAFPWAGVAVLSEDYETYRDGMEGQPLPLDAALAFNRAVVRFLQALGSPALQNHGLRLMKAAQDLVAATPTGDAGRAGSAFRREARFLLEPSAGADGFSAWDVIESATEVEAQRLLPGFRPNPIPGHRRAFDRLCAKVGEDAAGELMALLSFLAFLTTKPAESFSRLCELAVPGRDELRRSPAIEVLGHLGWTDVVDRLWDDAVAGVPMGTPYVVEPLRLAIQRLGRSRLIEVLARPAAHLDTLEAPEMRALLPPVIIHPSRDGRLVHRLNGAARDDPSLAGNALANVALYGAAL